MKRLGQAGITTGGGTLLYTVPTGMRTDILDICIANTTAGTLTCALHLIPSGGSVLASNMMFPNVSIAANTLVHWSGIQSLAGGDFIQGIGGSSGITVTISGDEQRSNGGGQTTS